VTDVTEQPATSLPSTLGGTGGPALPGPRRRMGKRLWLVFGLLAAAFVFLLVEGLGSSLNFFDTVNQAYAHRSTLGTTTFNLEGDVDRGSIHPTRLGTDFTISEGARRVKVVNTGSPPQLFQVNIPVVVIGHFTSATSSEFVSHLILVKHSANYIAAHPDRVKGKNGTVVK
jgi:cytochrome c-type biogenesis protein CcmE